MSRVFQNSGAHITQYFGNDGHTGTDCTPEGGGSDSIIAHSAGVVTFAQSGYGNWEGASGDASYGNCVKLQHDNGYSTLYAHMEYITVGYGDWVGRGQSIGYMGNSGNSTGPHLHFEVRDGYDNCIDSGAYLTSDLPGLDGGGSAGGGSGSGGGGGGGGSSAPAAPPKKDITTVVVKSVQGTAGTHDKGDLAAVKTRDNGLELLIRHDKTVQSPVLEGDVTVEWKRKGAPGCLKFTCLKSPGLSFQEGDPVSLRVGGKDLFYGYVFEKGRKDDLSISVTCYDQLRYFKNKDTLVYQDKTYGDLVQLLAGEYGLETGEIEATEHVIESRFEETTLFDMCAAASDLTVTSTGKLFVLYDDFGKICLKNIESCKVPILIDKDTAQSYDYKSSIDKEVYSRIRLARDNDETGEREIYQADNEDKQGHWGLLQLYEKGNDASPELLEEKAKVMLDYYGKKRRTLTVKKCLGDIRVRGGSSLVVMLGLGDIDLQNWMVVEEVKHTFSQGEHWMDLDVVGYRGEFIA